MRNKRQTTLDVREPRSQNGHDKWGRLGAASRLDKLSWQDVDSEDLKAALVAATEDGAALLLSKTSDGGALAIHVLADKSTYKLYPAHMNELTEALSQIVEIASGR